MITMTIIYLAGLVSGILLVVIALAGWIRKAGKELQGGDSYETQGRNTGINPNPHTGAPPVARDRANHRRRPDSSATGVA